MEREETKALDSEELIESRKADFWRWASATQTAIQDGQVGNIRLNAEPVAHETGTVCLLAESSGGTRGLGRERGQLPRIPVTVSEPRPRYTFLLNLGPYYCFHWFYHLSQEAPTLERNAHTHYFPRVHLHSVSPVESHGHKTDARVWVSSLGWLSWDSCRIKDEWEGGASLTCLFAFPEVGAGGSLHGLCVRLGVIYKTPLSPHLVHCSFSPCIG